MTRDRYPRPAGAATDPSSQRRLHGRRLLAELTALFLIATVVPVIVYLDMIVIFDMMSERSITEASQLLLLALTGVFFGLGALRQPEATGYLAIMSALAFLMSIRESDGLFDRVSQGFWIYPALLCLLTGAVLGWRNRATIRAPLLRHAASRHGMIVLLSLVGVLVFSRAFGSGDLWRAIMAENYTPQIKGAIQEGLELFGYALLAFGAAGSYLDDFR